MFGQPKTATLCGSRTRRKRSRQHQPNKANHERIKKRASSKKERERERRPANHGSPRTASITQPGTFFWGGERLYALGSARSRCWINGSPSAHRPLCRFSRIVSLSFTGRRALFPFCGAPINAPATLSLDPATSGFLEQRCQLSRWRARLPRPFSSARRKSQPPQPTLNRASSSRFQTFDSANRISRSLRFQIVVVVFYAVRFFFTLVENRKLTLRHNGLTTNVF